MPVCTHCTVLGNLPPSGQYEVDVTALEPGPHLFIINFDDGYGKSVMKIYPFSIGTGMYAGRYVCICAWVGMYERMSCIVTIVYT